jgi:ketosteroid isomerase-like protein
VLFSVYDPECEWDMAHYERWPETRVYRGHEGLGEFFTTWLEPWEDIQAGMTDAIDLPDDRVFVFARGSGQGRLSHAPVEIPRFAQIITFRDGKFLRVDNYSDIAAAQRAAGV